jgi:RNA polymerase sigma-54 factor
VRHLDPRPGLTEQISADATGYVIPDFEVRYHPNETVADNVDEQTATSGDFEIILNHRNAPRLRISAEYQAMWNDIKQEKHIPKAQETHLFFKQNMDNAKFFIEAIKQRQTTMLNVMRTIVALQEEFFRTGKGLKPMILDDIAKRIRMDISTVSRVTNGKYVQTSFGVFELKYFFNEKMLTLSGEEVANREIKDLLIKLIAEEDKTKPFSDQELVLEVDKHGYALARRTVAKYREQAGIPVARLRREIL